MKDDVHSPPPDYPGSRSNGAGSAMHSHHGGPASSIGPPPSHHTSVTMTTGAAPGASVTEINLNLGYFKTFPGILKLVQIVSFPMFLLKWSKHHILLYSFQILGIVCMALGAPAREFL